MLHIRKGEIPIVTLLLPFLAGIGLALYYHPIIPIALIRTAFATCALAFVTLNLLYNKLRVASYNWLGGLLLHIALFCAGWICLGLHLEIDQFNHFSNQKSKQLWVTIVTEPRQSAQYFRAVAEVKQVYSDKKAIPVTGRLLLTVVADSNSHPIAYGDELLIPANFKLVNPPFNPAEFNYRQYLTHQNIYHQTFITSHQLVKVARGKGNWLIAFALQLRQQMVQAFKAQMPHVEAAGVASTLVLGYKADLSPDITQAYSKTGTIHVLSVSGAHVAVIFWFISLLLRPLNRHSYGKWLSTIVSVLLIWGYALLTGFSPAVCRAALMISLIIIGKATSRQVHSLNVLAISAFALLLYNPLLITDVGFQLSYLAVAGLIVLQPLIAEQISFEHKWAQKLWYLCAASLAAQMVTFPLSAYYFHQFPVYFLISNLFIIIPSEVVMIGGMMFTFFSKVPILNSLLAHLLDYCILFMNKGLAFIGSLPMGSVGKIWITPAEHLLLYASLILLFIFLSTRKGWQLMAGLTAVLVLCVSVSFKSVSRSNANHLIFLDLKKHTGIILTAGNQAVVVTDLGKKDKAFQYSVQPCLDSLQIEQVTVLGLRQNVNTRFLHKNFNLLQFDNCRILIMDPHLEEAKLKRPVAVKYLLVTGSPHINLATICKNYTFDTLILDANNSKQRLALLTSEGRISNKKIISLTRNKALAIASN